MVHTGAVKICHRCPLEESKMGNVLIISESENAIQTIPPAIRPKYRVEIESNGGTWKNALRKNHHDIVFIDMDFLLKKSLPVDCDDALQSVKKINPSVEIVVMSPKEKIRQAIKIVKAGAFDYLRDQFWKVESLEVVRTRNHKMKQVFAKIRAVAPTKANVLLMGETGTGKSLLANMIHQHSNRQNAPFIEVHCGAIPDTLIESELFGHEKGAFTGAIRRKIGKFEMAKGGTIFLDEIGTITPSLQVKLLQILQDGTFSRVGGEKMLHIDARIITATNSNLKKMADAGHFRRDLFYRLNVFPIEIPSLRERIEDLPHLSNMLLNKLNRDVAKKIYHIHPNALKALKGYHWPGNIRELENILERALILETTTILCPESFPTDLFAGNMPIAPVPIIAEETLANSRKAAVKEFERQYIKKILTRNKGRINRSTEDTSVSTRQFYKLMTKYGIHKEKFRE